MMIAIFRANPSAFDGNINRLHRGAVLTIPSRAEVAAISKAEAKREVHAQMAAWRSPTRTGASTAQWPRRQPAAASTAAASPRRAAAAALGCRVPAARRRLTAHRRDSPRRATLTGSRAGARQPCRRGARPRVQSLEHELTRDEGPAGKRARSIGQACSSKRHACRPARARRAPQAAARGAAHAAQVRIFGPGARHRRPGDIGARHWPACISDFAAAHRRCAIHASMAGMAPARRRPTTAWPPSAPAAGPAAGRTQRCRPHAQVGTRSPTPTADAPIAAPIARPASDDRGPTLRATYSGGPSVHVDDATHPCCRY